ncbi:MAG: acyltransferase [Actinobacteria bacterium]|nr:acyltransferase [Actinomycetota bacterium]
MTSRRVDDVSSTSTRRRSDIEGLRALAVAMVLLYHAHVPGFGGGYVGVDVFFVLSGFLITGLLVNEREQTGRISFSLFYSRRVRRILPMSALVVVATLVTSYMWIEPLRLRELGSDAIGTASFSSNFLFANRGADYLQSTLPPSPLQHYWSLAVEEQFYVVWPVLVLVVCLGVRGSVRRRVSLLSIVVAASSFVACMITMERAQPWAFFAPHTRAFELALGALCATVPLARLHRSPLLASFTSWAGIALIIASATNFSEQTRFPGPWVLVPVVGTMLALQGGDSHRFAPNLILRAAPVQWLGSRSYSAYLWHWPVLIIAPAMLGNELTGTQQVMCLVIALGFTELGHVLIERPVHRNHSLEGRRALSLALATILISGAAGALVRNNPRTFSGGEDVAAPTLDSTTTSTLATSTTSGVPTTTIPVAPTLPPYQGPLQAIVDATKSNVLPANLTPSLGDALLDFAAVYQDDCHTSFSSVQQKNCIFGDPNGTTSVGLYGDSHAAQWFPGLEKVAIKRKWKLITYTKRGCPPADIEVWSKVLGRHYTECDAWRENVYKKMVDDKVKVVLVAQFDRLLSKETKIPIWQRDWRIGLQGTIDILKGLGITPILFADTPFPARDVPTCLSASPKDIDVCNPIPSAALRADIAEVREDLSVKNSVPLLRTKDWFCTANICPVVVGNILVYRDDNHITSAYAKFLGPVLDAALEPVVSWYSK